jgi:hypothetical protein
MMHIYGDTLASYAASDLPQPQLAALDAHVSNCMFCAHGPADEAVLASGWERRGWLGRLVRVEAPGSLDDSVEELDAKAA